MLFLQSARIYAQLTNSCAETRSTGILGRVISLTSRLRLTRPMLWAALAAIVSVTALAWIGGAIAERREVGRQISQLRTDLLLRQELLRSELERHRLLPAVLAEDRTLSEALAAKVSPTVRSEAVARLNPRFAALALRDGAATLYLIGADGRTVAASNHDSPASFIGQDYSFRPYFRDALRQGSGEFFAQGTVSGVPGLYLAQRLWDGSGVVVVKVEFGALESSWRANGDQTFATDAGGTVLVTSDPALRFTRDRTAAGAAADGRLRITADSAQPGWTLVATRDIRRARLGARERIGAAHRGGAQAPGARHGASPRTQVPGWEDGASQRRRAAYRGQRRRVGG